MKLIRFFIRLPIINILTFALFPKKAYKEYFLWILEEKGLTIDDVWNGLKPDEKEALNTFDIKPSADGLCQEPPVDISGGKVV